MEGSGSAREMAKIKERWEILVPSGASREIIYTNKGATHFSTEAAGANSRSYHGLFNGMYEYVDSWNLYTGGELLDPENIEEATAFPHTIQRKYSDPRVFEEICLPDQKNGLLVRFSGELGNRCAFVPWFDMRFLWDVPNPEYEIIWKAELNTLFISRIDKALPPERPVWVAVTADKKMSFLKNEIIRPTNYPKDAARRAMSRTNPFSPGRLWVRLDDGSEKSVIFSFGLGGSAVEAARCAEILSENFEIEKVRKLSRIEQLFVRATLPPLDPEADKTLRWAMVSMDNMIMNQRGKGIYAGFHWFPNYWGRDSFICLPGACLSTGAYDDAREILDSFMLHQESDPESSRLGRFPNIVNPDQLQYAGVDGTWWLLRAAWKYYRITGDDEFLIVNFPRVERAIEGAIAKAVDGSGFLTHGEGETWMDAGGEVSPFTPRGNRAVEVQALFHHGLLVGSAWAGMVLHSLESSEPDSPLRHLASPDFPHPGELAELADAWDERARRLKSTFNEFFRYEERHYLFDHLDSDDTPDTQIRPNAILAVWVSLDAADFRGLPEAVDAERFFNEPLIDSNYMESVVRTALETIVLPHGVTSLYPEDPDFHPLHLDLDNYYYDEAYHNGDVWEWLTGPMISCLLAVGELDSARELFKPLYHEILNEGCVGSLREIRDGADTKGKEEFGGATSQAWSLAEFIRIALQEPRLFPGKLPVSHGNNTP